MWNLHEGGQRVSGSGPDVPNGSRAHATGLVHVRAKQAEALDLLARMPPRAASKALAAKYGLSRRQANRYISAALAEQCADSLAEPPESKVARAKLRAEKLYELALAKTRTVMDEKTAEGVLKYHEVPDPDVRAGVQANAQLMQIDAIVPPSFTPGREPKLGPGGKP